MCSLLTFGAVIRCIFELWRQPGWLFCSTGSTGAHKGPRLTVCHLVWDNMITCNFIWEYWNMYYEPHIINWHDNGLNLSLAFPTDHEAPPWRAALWKPSVITFLIPAAAMHECCIVLNQLVCNEISAKQAWGCIILQYKNTVRSAQWGEGTQG